LSHVPQFLKQRDIDSYFIVCLPHPLNLLLNSTLSLLPFLHPSHSTLIFLPHSSSLYRYSLIPLPFSPFTISLPILPLPSALSLSSYPPPICPLIPHPFALTPAPSLVPLISFLSYQHSPLKPFPANPSSHQTLNLSALSSIPSSRSLVLCPNPSSLTVP
jgi:hypothetical protein